LGHSVQCDDTMTCVSVNNKWLSDHSWESFTDLEWMQG